MTPPHLKEDAAAKLFNSHQARKETAMRKVFGVFTLTVLLTCSAHAGIMPNGDEPLPPPPPATEETAGQSQPGDTDGDINNPPADAVTEITLDLFSSILSLF